MVTKKKPTEKNLYTKELGNLKTLSSDDIRQLSLAMTELATSLYDFVTYMRENPELTKISESMRELTKRISILSTRL